MVPARWWFGLGDCPSRSWVIMSGQIITTSAEVTPNGGLIREYPQNGLNSGLGIIVICPDYVACELCRVKTILVSLHHSLMEAPVDDME